MDGNHTARKQIRTDVIILAFRVDLPNSTTPLQNFNLKQRKKAKILQISYSEKTIFYLKKPNFRISK